MSSVSLLIRALFAFVAMPGMVAYVVPLLLAPEAHDRRAWQWLGMVLAACGSALLLWCVRDFYKAGKGTLAPWSPPQRLVTSGPYARSRNPMYVAVSAVLMGWAVWYASTTLLLYALGVMIAFHLRVVLYEEPRLLAVFGEAWTSYGHRVRRWL